MERVELNFTATIVDAGFNVTTINSASSALNLWWQWTQIGRPLVEAYGAANEGRFPPVDTARRGNWRNAQANLSQEIYDAALPVIQSFRDWFNDDFMPYNAETCSESM